MPKIPSHLQSPTRFFFPVYLTAGLVCLFACIGLGWWRTNNDKEEASKQHNIFSDYHLQGHGKYLAMQQNNKLITHHTGDSGSCHSSLITFKTSANTPKRTILSTCTPSPVSTDDNHSKENKSTNSLFHLLTSNQAWIGLGCMGSLLATSYFLYHLKQSVFRSPPSQSLQILSEKNNPGKKSTTIHVFDQLVTTQDVLLNDKHCLMLIENNSSPELDDKKTPNKCLGIQWIQQVDALPSIEKRRASLVQKTRIILRLFKIAADNNIEEVKKERVFFLRWLLFYTCKYLDLASLKLLLPTKKDIQQNQHLGLSLAREWVPEVVLYHLIEGTKTVLQERTKNNSARAQATTEDYRKIITYLSSLTDEPIKKKLKKSLLYSDTNQVKTDQHNLFHKLIWAKTELMLDHIFIEITVAFAETLGAHEELKKAYQKQTSDDKLIPLYYSVVINDLHAIKALLPKKWFNTEDDAKYISALLNIQDHQGETLKNLLQCTQLKPISDYFDQLIHPKERKEYPPHPTLKSKTKTPSEDTYTYEDPNHRDKKLSCTISAFEKSLKEHHPLGKEHYAMLLAMNGDDMLLCNWLSSLGKLQERKQIKEEWNNKVTITLQVIDAVNKIGVDSQKDEREKQHFIYIFLLETSIAYLDPCSFKKIISRPIKVNESYEKQPFSLLSKALAHLLNQYEKLDDTRSQVVQDYTEIVQHLANTVKNEKKYPNIGVKFLQRFTQTEDLQNLPKELNKVVALEIAREAMPAISYLIKKHVSLEERRKIYTIKTPKKQATLLHHIAGLKDLKAWEASLSPFYCEKEKVYVPVLHQLLMQESKDQTVFELLLCWLAEENKKNSALLLAFLQDRIKEARKEEEKKESKQKKKKATHIEPFFQLTSEQSKRSVWQQIIDIDHKLVILYLFKEVSKERKKILLHLDVVPHTKVIPYAIKKEKLEALAGLTHWLKDWPLNEIDTYYKNGKKESVITSALTGKKLNCKLFTLLAFPFMHDSIKINSFFQQKVNKKTTLATFIANGKENTIECLAFLLYSYKNQPAKIKTVLQQPAPSLNLLGSIFKNTTQDKKEGGKIVTLLKGLSLSDLDHPSLKEQKKEVWKIIFAIKVQGEKNIWEASQEKKKVKIIHLLQSPYQVVYNHE